MSAAILYCRPSKMDADQQATTRPRAQLAPPHCNIPVSCRSLVKRCHVKRCQCRGPQPKNSNTTFTVTLGPFGQGSYAP